jgi:hypothetical protein
MKNPENFFIFVMTRKDVFRNIHLFLDCTHQRIVTETQIS